MMADFGPEREEGEAGQREAAGEVGRAAEKHILEVLAEMAEDLGVDDLAAQHDHYLYGVEKEE